MSESIKATIYRILSSAAITPYIYHGDLPQNPSYPATVYDIISQPAADLTEDVGVVGFRKARIQIDVYAQSVGAAEDAMERYYELLKSYSGSIGDGASPETVIDCDIWDEGANPDMDFEDEPTLRQIEGRSRDFMIHW
ncbi:hypothetical protein EHM92_00310 [bacterium]|nr:MAG: hypothetical protein EHM92_00310 [bacterium]